MANGGLATYLEGLDLSQGGSVRIGLVLFGTTDDGARTILPLTPYDDDHLDEITDAFNEAAEAPEGSANLEVAIALADQMLDKALVETGGSSDYQTLAIISDGMATSWGVGEQQTFNYEDKNGDKTNEPSDDFLRGHVQCILSLLSHCYIDTDGDGTKERFGEASTNEPGTYDPSSGWMKTPRRSSRTSRTMLTSR